MRHVLLYSVLRLGLFLVVWVLLMAAGMHYLVAGALGALIAMLLSILLLRSPREGAAQRWKAADEARRERRAGQVPDQDAAEEDALVDGDDDVTETPGGAGTAGAAGTLPLSDHEAQQQED